jgi:hypothetical protein
LRLPSALYCARKTSSENSSIVDLINVQRGDVVEIVVLPNVAA